MRPEKGNRKKKGVEPVAMISAPTPKEWPAKAYYLITAIVCFLVFSNSCYNEFALDDGIVITDNPATIKGLDGIGDIFIYDTFHSVEGAANQLSGGRYRPLSVAMFAVEVEFFGLDPGIFHFMNVLLYTLTCLLLLYFLRNFVFRTQPEWSLLAVLLFAVHPTHTEIVSNIKGRDEILALLLLSGAFIGWFFYLEKKRFLWLVFSLILFFLSFLSKESGITWLAVFPLSAWFFGKEKTLKSVFVSGLYFIPFLVYFLIRYQVMGLVSASSDEIMNSPFVLASNMESFATKVFILGKYLLLFFVPWPLSYDYSYAQIPYVGIGSIYFWGSVMAHAGLVWLAIRFFPSRSPISFGILFWLATISIASNFLFNIGAPLNDRFLFQPSFGAALALCWWGSGLASKKKIPGWALKGPFLGMILIFSMLSFNRNPDWKNNESLFLKDVQTVPNSAKANVFAGVAHIKRAEAIKAEEQKKIHLERALPFLRKALLLYPDFADAHINLGNAASQLGMLEEARVALLKAKKKYPSNRALGVNLQYLSQKFNERSAIEFRQGKIMEAILSGSAAVECNPRFQLAWYNLGGYYLSKGDSAKSLQAWKYAFSLDTTNREINMWLSRIFPGK